MLTEQERKETFERDVFYFVAECDGEVWLAGNEPENADGYIVRASSPGEAQDVVRVYLDAPGEKEERVYDV